MVCFPYYNTLMHKVKKRLGDRALRRQWKKGADDAGMGCKKIVANCGEITWKASFQIRADSL